MCPALANHLKVPFPHLGRDRLPDRPQNPQRRHAGHVTVAPGRALEQPERRGGRVKVRHAVRRYDIPAARGARVRRGALENDGRDAQQERGVHGIGVAGDPAEVAGAKVAVAVVHVECVFPRDGRAQEVAGRAVQHALGLSGRARGVEQEEGVFRVDGLGCHVRLPFFHLLVPPQITARREGYVAGGGGGSAGPLVDQDVCDAAVVVALQREVHDSFEADGLAATPRLVGGDDDFAPGVQDAVAQGAGRKARKDGRVDGTDPDDG